MIIAVPRELPKGVIVRQKLSSRLPPNNVTLPFYSFESFLCGKLPIKTAGHQANWSQRVIRKDSTSANIWSHDSAIEQALQAVVPNEGKIDEPFDSSLMTPDSQVFASPLYRSIMFSVANNFAGIGALPKEKVIEFLQRETSATFYRMILSAPNYYATQAIALNLFRASVDAGEAGIVDFLIRQSFPSIQLNQKICFSDGLWGEPKCTPIAKAAWLWHKDVVRTLLEHGADASKTSCVNKYRSIPMEGALGFALSALRGSHRNDPPKRVDLELFEMLANAEPEITEGHLENIIDLDREGSILRLILSKFTAKIHDPWRKPRILCLALKSNYGISLEILGHMISHGLDLNLGIEHHNYTLVAEIIDKVAKHGDLPTVNILLDAGAQLTDDTLSCAISSGNAALVQYLIDHGARTDRMGTISPTERIDRSRFKQPPLAAAIRRKNQEILDLVVRHEGLRSLGHLDCYRSALRAALDVGDAKWIEYLVGIEGEMWKSSPDSVLGHTIRAGQEELALALIEAGADIDPRGSSSRVSALDEALRRRSSVLVRSLLDADATPTSSSIALAAEWGARQVLQDLIRCQSHSRSSRIANGASAFNVAVRRKDYGSIECLLDAGYDINDDFEALATAVRTGDRNLIAYVFDCGADPHDIKALTESMKQSQAVLELLLEKHAARYPKGRGDWGSPALKMAVCEGNYELFKKVLDSGGDANGFLNSYGRLVGERQVTRLDDEGDVNGFEVSGKGSGEATTPFGYAIMKSEKIGVKFVELLLQSKCSSQSIVFMTRLDGGAGYVTSIVRLTAFLAAVSVGYRPTIELLLKHHADVNFPARFPVKRTPLQRAVEVGNMATVKFLLESGADVNAPAAKRGGGTALQLAAIQGFFAIACLLLDRGADVNAPASNVDGRTALEGAAEHGRLDMVAILLEAGAGHQGRDRAQFTRAIDLALKNGYTYISDMLDRYLVDGKVSSGPPPSNDMFDYIDWDQCESSQS